MYRVIHANEVYTRYKRREDMNNVKVNIKLKAYDHRVLDKADSGVDVIKKRTGGNISGPVPLPAKKRSIYCIKKAVHKYGKDSEQFERRTHEINRYFRALVKKLWIV